jgi:DNA invertase Pin-like site-specific DNA recombinase
METLGYLYDEPSGIWTKPGWKEIKDGKPHFPNIIGRRARGKNLTDNDKKKIIELYDRGVSVDDITIQLNVSDTTVYRYVTKTRQGGRS